ncbi:hypothetical protein [Haloarchaeobius sp. HRN-SO-5]|uniref:hypothetical protein n=1 Tax=Haloarchaeobius sp. HRN-SO-5 TaxID=3446118 RepID=UPI003EB83C05
MGLSGQTDIGGGGGVGLAEEAGTWGTSSTLSEAGTKTVSFANTYTTATLETGCITQETFEEDGYAEIHEATLKSWVTDPEGNISGANIFYWKSSSAYGNTFRWHVMGELA